MNGSKEVKEVKEKVFYQCFSDNLKDYLVNCGHSILLRAKHCETDKVFWCFLYDKEEKLKNDLVKWSNSKRS